MKKKMSKTFLSCSLLGLMFTLSGALQGAAQSRSYTVQIASAPSEEEARAMTEKLKSKGLEAYWVKANVPGIGLRYRVRIGKFKTSAEAKAAGERGMSRNEIKEFLITAYEAPAAGNAPGDSIAENKPRSKPEPTPEAAAPPLLAESKPPAIAAPPPPVVETPAEKEPKPAAAGESAATSAAPKAVAAPTPTAEEPKPGEAKIETKAEPKAETRPPAKTTAVKGPAPKSAAANIDLPATAVAESLTDVSFSNEHWKIVRRSAAADKNLRSIYFVDAMTGWAAGDSGVVHRTTDGGRNWKPMVAGAPANINFIYFVDWNNGWMLGDASNEDGGETVLFMTTNGGKTWARKPMPNLLSLHFIDPKNGWAVGRNATLMKTKDGGENWTKIDSMESLIGLPVESTSYNYGFRDIQFIDALHGWLIGNFYGRARNNIGGVFFTTDGGATWKRAPITIQAQQVSGRFTPGVFESIKFTDLSTGSITGEMNDGESRYSIVLHTKDGGKTWNQFRTPSRAVHSNTQFLDLANGWMAASAPREGGETAVFDTTMMRTDNGGQSWRDDFVAKGRRIRSVFFLSPTKGWAVGDRGMILRYDEKSRVN
jgi:photosystem II stability/assembly factor-like uncharacterized protein